MGGIYFLTILYALNSVVQASAVTGTYPILANYRAYQHRRQLGPGML